MLVLLGTNHRSAPLDVRERMAISDAQLVDKLPRLTTMDGVREAVILSTCNRVELLVEAESADRGLRALRAFLEQSRGVTAEVLDRYGYHHFGRDAVRHLFRVASGLDSMILGEPQITGQVKQAYRCAREAGTTGAVLERLLQHALSAAKRVRTETGVSRNAVSVASVAVELARQIFGSFAGRSALVLGAGKMAALVATHLRAQGVARIVVSSRSYQRAARLASRCGGIAANWDEMGHHLAMVDIVVSGTAAMELVLTLADVRGVLRVRRGQPLFIIDIAVPRDVDPRVNELDNVYVYDVDDLQGVVDAHLEARSHAAASAAELIEREVETFEQWVQSLAVAPTIVALRESLLALGERELERFRRRLEPMNPQQQQAVHELVRAVIQKILHRPIRHLKASAGHEEGARSARLFREVFVDGAGRSERDGEPAGGDTQSGERV
jgi:glutamyl-tRNA reductase